MDIDYLIPSEAAYERECALDDALERAFEARFESLLEDILDGGDISPFLEDCEVFHGVSKFLKTFDPFRNLVWEQACAEVRRDWEDDDDF